MAIKGSLREASLPDVLQLLAMGGKTGCLSLTDRSHFGYIYFDSGRICYAAIVNRRDRLGVLLVKNGLLDPAELAAAVDEQRASPGRRLGEILIDRGAITPEHLAHYIRIQVEEAVYFLFTWSQGSFFFEADQQPEEGAMRVSINPENLLLEGARRVDEWSLIEKKIPSLDLIFEVGHSLPLPDELVLTEEQRRLLPLLDGGHSVAEIIEESGMVEFEVGKSLFGLIQAGLVIPVGKRERSTLQHLPTSRIGEHRNLGVAFYKTAMYEEAVREFRRVLELQPGDLEARFLLGLIDLHRGDDRGAVHYLRQVLERGGPRAPALLNLAVALERMGRLDSARSATEEALRIAPRSPAVLLSHAILLLKSKRVEEAAETFSRYRDVLPAAARPPAVYFAFALLAEAALGRSGDAIDVGNQGLSLHPHSAPLLLHLGIVRERQGEWEEAEALYRRACEEDPTLAPAQKSLGDALYRRGAHDEAARAYHNALHHAPDLGDDVYFKLGNICYKRMEREEAIRLWRRSLEINPENSMVRTNLEVVESALRDAAVGPPAGSASTAAVQRGAAREDPGSGSVNPLPGYLSYVDD